MMDKPGNIDFECQIECFYIWEKNQSFNRQQKPIAVVVVCVMHLTFTHVTIEKNTTNIALILLISHVLSI